MYLPHLKFSDPLPQNTLIILFGLRKNTITLLEHVERKAVSSTEIRVKEGFFTKLPIVNLFYSCDSLIYSATVKSYH